MASTRRITSIGAQVATAPPVDRQITSIGAQVATTPQANRHTTAIGAQVATTPQANRRIASIGVQVAVRPSPYAESGDTYIAFDGLVLSGRYTSIERSDGSDLVDRSAGSDTHDYFLDALRNGAYTIHFHHEAGDTATLTSIAPGTEGTIVYAPEGLIDGHPVYSARSMVDFIEGAETYNGLSLLAVSFENQENITAQVF